jgi:major intracellular serine protease
MKKLSAILAVLMSVTFIPAHAASPKTMVIIDTGVDLAHKAIKNNIIYEACFSGYNSCPNGKSFMEGSGSATVTPAMYANDAWSHGTKVASAAVQTDPNVKIIEIRCASLIGANGYIGCNPVMLTNALNWVYDNKDKLNIGIVVSPLGSYSTTCDLSATYVEPINRIIASGIGVAFPTGNDFKYVSIDNPACVPGVLAISAIDDKGRLALYANYSSRVDFASNGNLTVAMPGNKYGSDYGTSLSVATFGASWLNILNSKNLSYKDEYNLVKNTGTAYTNIMVKQNVVAINMVKAVQ